MYVRLSRPLETLFASLPPELYKSCAISAPSTVGAVRLHVVVVAASTEEATNSRPITPTDRRSLLFILWFWFLLHSQGNQRLFNPLGAKRLLFCVTVVRTKEPNRNHQPTRRPCGQPMAVKFTGSLFMAIFPPIFLPTFYFLFCDRTGD